MKFLSSMLSALIYIALGVLAVMYYAEHKNIHDAEQLLTAAISDLKRYQGVIILIVLQPFILGAYFFFTRNRKNV